jgi:hypothetical protein
MDDRWSRNIIVMNRPDELTAAWVGVIIVAALTIWTIKTGSISACVGVLAYELFRFAGNVFMFDQYVALRSLALLVHISLRSAGGAARGIWPDPADKIDSLRSNNACEALCQTVGTLPATGVLAATRGRRRTGLFFIRSREPALCSADCFLRHGFEFMRNGSSAHLTDRHSLTSFGLPPEQSMHFARIAARTACG